MWYLYVGKLCILLYVNDDDFRGIEVIVGVFEILGRFLRGRGGRGNRCGWWNRFYCRVCGNFRY